MTEAQNYILLHLRSSYVYKSTRRVFHDALVIHDSDRFHYVMDNDLRFRGSTDTSWYVWPRSILGLPLLALEVLGLSDLNFSLDDDRTKLASALYNHWNTSAPKKSSTRTEITLSPPQKITYPLGTYFRNTTTGVAHILVASNDPVSKSLLVDLKTGRSTAGIQNNRDSRMAYQFIALSAGDSISITL